jgi:hypothetical protein
MIAIKGCRAVGRKSEVSLSFWLGTRWELSKDLRQMSVDVLFYCVDGILLSKGLLLP